MSSFYLYSGLEYLSFYLHSGLIWEFFWRGIGHLVSDRPVGRSRWCCGIEILSGERWRIFFFDAKSLKKWENPGRSTGHGTVTSRYLEGKNMFFICDVFAKIAKKQHFSRWNSSFSKNDIILPLLRSRICITILALRSHIWELLSTCFRSSCVRPAGRPASLTSRCRDFEMLSRERRQFFSTQNLSKNV